MGIAHTLSGLGALNGGNMKRAGDSRRGKAGGCSHGQDQSELERTRMYIEQPVIRSMETWQLTQNQSHAARGRPVLLISKIELNQLAKMLC